jgi:hypothetical protein
MFFISLLHGVITSEAMKKHSPSVRELFLFFNLFVSHNYINTPKNIIS